MGKYDRGAVRLVLTEQQEVLTVGATVGAGVRVIRGATNNSEMVTAPAVLLIHRVVVQGQCPYLKRLSRTRSEQNSGSSNRLEVPVVVVVEVK